MSQKKKNRAIEYWADNSECPLLNIRIRKVGYWKHVWCYHKLHKGVIHSELWRTDFDQDFPDMVRERMAKFIKKAISKVTAREKAAEAADPVFAKQCPALFEFMTCVQLDGQKRETASITAFAQDGTWRACLNDRDSQLTLWVEADTFQGLFSALEARLTSEDPGWRIKTDNGQNLRKKKH